MKSKFFFMLPFFCLLFFLSGACGLIYEIIWVRKLGLIFGNTTFAISTVLAAFMAGLGLGSYFFGYRIDRKGNPLFWYALLEISIGIFCLLTPFLWNGAEGLYVWAYQALKLNFWSLSVFRFLICFAILFVPTFLMGGTLPVLTKFFVQTSKETAKGLGLLYGINTLGAVVGVLFASFFAIYFFGLQGAVTVVSAVNIFIGIAALFFLRLKDFIMRKRGREEDVQSPGVERPDTLEYNEGRVSEPALVKLLLVSFALSGFTSMAYELCWTRVLALCLGSSVYSFAVMLASFLTGLGIGSLVIGWLSKRMRIDYFSFAAAQVLVAFFALWGTSLFNQMPLYFLQLFSEYGNDTALFHAAKFFLASFVILPPAIFIGTVFAMVAQLVNRSAAMTGAAVGGAYLVNTIGCIAGSVMAGFLFIPWIGIYKTLLAMITINFLIGVFMFAVSQKRPSVLRKIIMASLVVGTGIFFTQVQPWSKGLLTTNIAIDPKAYLGHSKYEILDSVDQNELLYYKEGLTGTVSVKRNRYSIALAINANIDASSGFDMHTQLMLGHLPTLFAENPTRALVIGMGSGVTLGALSAYPYQSIHCVELEAGVIEAAKFFSKENRNVLHDPRLKNFINDGRNHLLAEDFIYDVIVSEPSSPWMAGVANLFTVEQFELMKKRLAPNGVACQWLNTYSMSPQNLQMIIKTFRRAFKHVSLWQAIGVDLLLLGSDRELVLDMNAVNQKINENSQLQKDLADVQIYDAAGILSSFLLNNDELARLSQGGIINSDNFPYLEYFAPLNLYGFEGTISQNLQMISSFRRARYPKIANGPTATDEKIKFHNALARVFIQNNNLYEAGVEIGLANQEQPFNRGSILNYGMLEAAAGNADKAIEDLTNYLKDDPLDADAHFYLAKAYAGKQADDLALAHYASAVECAPKDYQYVFEYGQALLKNSQAKDAINAFQEAVKLKGLNLQNGILLSRAFFLDKQFAQAIETLNLLLKDYPHFFDVYQAMADSYESERRYQEGLFLCQRVKQLLPFNAQNYYLMSQFYKKVGKEKDAYRMMRIYSFYQNAPKIGTRNF